MTKILSRSKAASRSRSVQAPIPPATDPRTQCVIEAEQALAADDLARTEQICRKGLGFGGRAELERLLGVAVHRQGRSVEAQACFTRAVAMAAEGSRTAVEAAYAKGRLHLAVGQVEEAVEALRLSSRHDPDNAETHRRLGCLPSALMAQI